MKPLALLSGGALAGGTLALVPAPELLGWLAATIFTIGVLTAAAGTLVLACMTTGEQEEAGIMTGGAG